MATGYVVNGVGDLDDLFKPRVSAAIANTGFQSNGGVDLAQRFEARGSVPARANTNFVSGSTDLAQLFRDINFGTMQVNTSILAGVNGANVGYRNDPNFSPAFGSTPNPNFTNGQRNDGVWYTGSQSYFTLSLPSNAIPLDSDVTFSRIQFSGNWASGAASRLYTKSQFTSDFTFLDGGRGYRRWRLISGSHFDMQLANSYAFIVWCNP